MRPVLRYRVRYRPGVLSLARESAEQRPSKGAMRPVLNSCHYQTTVKVSVVSGAVVHAPVASVNVGVDPLVCDTMTAA